jgi:hypothetical protein
VGCNAAQDRVQDPSFYLLVKPLKRGLSKHAVKMNVFNGELSKGR